MSRTVYVVERVVFDVFVSDADRSPSLFDWVGSNGDHIARVPVAAFADRTAAEADAARREGEFWQAISPAVFASELREPRHTTVRNVLRRHGIDPPVFYHHDAVAGYTGVRFPYWWADHVAQLAPSVVAAVCAAFDGEYGCYRVEARTLED